MKVTQSYNQNAVSVVDKNGKELVLIGKGIGFGKKKGDIIDIRKASKVFSYYYSDYEKKVIDLLVDIPEDIILMAEEITIGASKILKEELNPVFLFSLSAHIQFTLERNKEYGEIVEPLNYDLKYIYPKEYEAAQWAVNYLKTEYGIFLYDSEVTFFTFHFVNGLQNTEKMTEVVELSNILGDIVNTIDKEFPYMLNKDSMSYSRLILHLRYFLMKYYNGDITNNEDIDNLYVYVSDKFVLANKIVKVIENLLQEKYELNFNSDDNLYLLLHIQRLLDDHSNIEREDNKI